VAVVVVVVVDDSPTSYVYLYLSPEVSYIMILLGESIVQHVCICFFIENQYERRRRKSYETKDIRSTVWELLDFAS